VWLRYYDGPVENGSFPEPTPSPGVYTSNVATLIVVSDDTPGVLRPAAFEPADDPRRAPRVISHGGVDFAWAHDLARFGVAAKVDDRMRELALTRGKRRLILPITGDVVVANARAPVAAIPTLNPTQWTMHFLIPVRPIAAAAGMEVRVDAERKTFRLTRSK
jgi:hypothetical protein